MEQKTSRINPSSKKKDYEQKLEKILPELKSFDNSTNNLTVMIIDFKDKKQKIKKKTKKNYIKSQLRYENHS